MSIVLHLMPATEWHRLGDGEPIANPSLASEGFIHCTDDPGVMLQIANAYYAAQPGDFVVLEVDVERLSSPCIWEDPAHIGGSGESFAPQFPHIYGPIDRDAVVAVQPVTRDASGRFTTYATGPPSA